MFSIMPLLTLALLIFAMFIAIIKRDDKSSLGSFLLFILLVLLAGLRDVMYTLIIIMKLRHHYSIPM